MKVKYWEIPFFALILLSLVVVSKIPRETHQGSIKDNTIKSTPTKKEDKNNYEKGEVVFDRLKNKVCEELDLCWITQGYMPNGDRILKKEFPTTWGEKKIILIPKPEWIALSKTDKDNLGDYLKNINIDEVVVGRVKPAEFSDGTINPDRNVITVDETVWNSTK